MPLWGEEGLTYGCNKEIKEWSKTTLFTKDFLHLSFLNIKYQISIYGIAMID